jgi:hypothetical protein
MPQVRPALALARRRQTQRVSRAKGELPPSVEARLAACGASCVDRIRRGAKVPAGGPDDTTFTGAAAPAAYGTGRLRSLRRSLYEGSRWRVSPKAGRAPSRRRLDGASPLLVRYSSMTRPYVELSVISAAEPKASLTGSAEKGKRAQNQFAAQTRAGLRSRQQPVACPSNGRAPFTSVGEATFVVSAPPTSQGACIRLRSRLPCSSGARRSRSARGGGRGRLAS